MYRNSGEESVGMIKGKTHPFGFHLIFSLLFVVTEFDTLQIGVCFCM